MGGLGLKDHIDFVTHWFGNSLDPVITSQDDLIVNTVIQGELFSDHHWVFFNISSSTIMYGAEEIRKHRQMEHIWRWDRVNLDKCQDFCTQCRLVSNLLFATEKEYYRDTFHEHSGNIKQVFKLCNSLLGRGKEHSLPPGLNNQELADNFNKFFITKITNIRSDLSECDTGSSDTQSENCLIPNALMNF